jgi:hypothetical protein
MHIKGNVGKAIIKQLYGEKDSNFREACEDFERHPDVWIIVDPNTSIEQRPSAPWDTYYTRKKRLLKSHRRDAIPYRFEL